MLGVDPTCVEKVPWHMPGVSGLSPYEIVYGRRRPLAGLPNEVPRVCEDAVEFFKKMEE